MVEFINVPSLIHLSSLTFWSTSQTLIVQQTPWAQVFMNSCLCQCAKRRTSISKSETFFICSANVTDWIWRQHRADFVWCQCDIKRVTHTSLDPQASRAQVASFVSYLIPELHDSFLSRNPWHGPMRWFHTLKAISYLAKSISQSGLCREHQAPDMKMLDWELEPTTFSNCYTFSTVTVMFHKIVKRGRSSLHANSNAAQANEEAFHVSFTDKRRGWKLHLRKLNFY